MVEERQHVPQLLRLFQPLLEPQWSLVVRSGKATGQLQIGTRVMLNGVGSTSALAGQQGSITAVHLDSYAITLDGGLQVSNAKKESVVQVPNGTEVRDEPATTGQQSADEFYAPFAVGGSAGKSTTTSRENQRCFEQSLWHAAMVSSWASLFWQAIKNDKTSMAWTPPLSASYRAMDTSVQAQLVHQDMRN